MANPEWGTKRACLSCGARFYDLNRTPIVCPKCGASHDAEDFNRSRRPRSSNAAKTPEKAPAVAELAVADADATAEAADAAEAAEAAEASEAPEPAAPDPTDDVELDAGGELEDAVVEAEVPTLEPEDDGDEADDDSDEDDDDIIEDTSSLGDDDLDEVIPRKVGTGDEA